MPKLDQLTPLPTDFTYKEAYAILSDDQKKAVREEIIKLGVSKETFHRWLREDCVPLVFKEHFRIQLNKHLNANGKFLS